MKTRQIENLTNYIYLASKFRNGMQLIRSFRNGPRCHTAVLWDGTRLVHPNDRDGLVGTILEVWKNRCYTRRGFYAPQSGDQIVDVGAHIGLFSMSMAFENRDCRILALEPFPENFQCLIQNIESAGIENVKVQPLAIGESNRNAFMHPVGTRSIDHLLRSSAGQESHAVKVISLSGILDYLPDDRIALLKMDVEGAEYDAFNTAPRETLQCFERIAIEYHDNLRPGTLDLLKQRLEPTHDLVIEPTFERGYGILLAKRR